MDKYIKKIVICSDGVLQEALRVGCKHRQRRHLPTSANSFWYWNNQRPTTCIDDTKALGAFSGSSCRAPETVVGRKEDSSREAERLAPAVSPNAIFYPSLHICYARNGKPHNILLLCMARFSFSYFAEEALRDFKNNTTWEENNLWANSLVYVNPCLVKKVVKMKFI